MQRRYPKLREIIRPTKVTAALEDSIRDVAVRMGEAGVCAVPIVENGRIVGMISERDLTRNAVARGLSPDETCVSQVMDRHPARICDDRDLASARMVMRVRGVRELLVQDFTGHVVGVFCDCDSWDGEVSP